jgi:hypothetical protein
MSDILISTAGMEWKAEIDDTRAGRIIRSNLPIEGRANRWGDEIYFEIPVDIPLSPEAHDTPAVGDLAYWPTGKAFCIFFGPTPVSRGDEPRAAGPVEVFGRILADVEKLTSVSDGATVRVEAA